MSYQRYVLTTFGQAISGPIYQSWNKVTVHFNLEKENKILSEENSRLMQLLTQNYLMQDDGTYIYSEIQGDSIKKKKVQLYSYQNAAVVFNTTTKTYNYMIIDKGAEEGIVTNMAVIAPSGVVGIVDQVSKHFASVVSLLHPNTRISAKVMPVNQIGTISWDDGNPEEVTLHDIPQHQSVNIGDSVFTSGYSAVFPENILIGLVKNKTSNTNNSFLNISVKLAVNFNNINHVYIVKNLFKNEMDTLKAGFKHE